MKECIFWSGCRCIFIYGAKDISKVPRIRWKNFQVVVLTLSSSKNNFTWHVKFENTKKVDFSKNWCWMSSSWDEFLPSKIRTLGVVGRSWAKIHHDTPLESIFWKNHFLIIFDFSFVGLWILSAEFWFFRPNIGRSVIFSENIHL